MAQKSNPIQYPLTLTFNLILNIREIPFKLRDDIATFFNTHIKPSSSVVSSESVIPSSDQQLSLTDGDVKLKVGVAAPIIPEKNDSPDTSHPSVNLALSIPPTPDIDNNNEDFGLPSNFYEIDTAKKTPIINNTKSDKTPNQEEDAEIKLQLVIPSPVTDNQEKNKNKNEDEDVNVNVNVNNDNPIVQDESNQNKISLNVQINSQKSTENDNNNTTSTNLEEIDAAEDQQEDKQDTNSKNGKTDTSSGNTPIIERHDSENSEIQSVFRFDKTINETDKPVVAPVLETPEFKNNDEKSIVSLASFTNNSMIMPHQQSNDSDDFSISSQDSFFNSSSSNKLHIDDDSVSIKTNDHESLYTSDDDEYANNSSVELGASTTVSVETPPLSTVQPANANENDLPSINHIGLRGTIYFYVNQESPTPQLVSGDINHYFDVKDTNITCETNFPIQITHKIDGNSTTSPFNANVTINGNLCIHGHIYNITDGQQITVGNITHIPPRPDTTFTIRETDKQFVNKYFEYSGKIYVDDWNSKIHWHTYYNPENYKVSSFDFTKEKDTLGVFNIGNLALYKRKINMYIGEVTVMGNIHISPPPFNIDLKKTSVSGGSPESTSVDHDDKNIQPKLQQEPFVKDDSDQTQKEKGWVSAKPTGKRQPSQRASLQPEEYIHNESKSTVAANDMYLSKKSIKSDKILNNLSKPHPTSSTNPSKSRPASSTEKNQNIEDSKVASASQSVSDSRRNSRSSSTDPPSNLTSHPPKSKELIDIETEYKEWKKESGEVGRFPYRAYYNNKEKSTESEGILTENLIDCILFYRSLENKPDLQNEFIDNIHHFLDADFFYKINPLVQTILETQAIQENANAPSETIPQDIIDLGDYFENEKNETNEYTLLRQTNPPHSDKPIASNLLLPAITRVRAARKELLNKAVKLLLEQNKSKDSSIISDNTSQKKQAETTKDTKVKGTSQYPDKKTSNGSQYKIQISGTLHTLVGEGKIHHTFYLVESPQTNGEETHTHTLTKIERDKTDAFSKYIDAKFHISGSWIFVPKKITGKQDVPDFPKQVYFGEHDIDLPFMYKKPTDQNEQPASIEIKQIHIYKIVDNTDELLISGSIALFDGKIQSTLKKKLIHFAPLVYDFNSKMKINVENKGQDLVQFKGYVVNNEGTRRIVSKSVTKKTRPMTAPANRNTGGRRTRRFRKNLKT